MISDDDFEKWKNELADYQEAKEFPRLTVFLERVLGIKPNSRRGRAIRENRETNGWGEVCYGSHPILVDPEAAIAAIKEGKLELYNGRSEQAA